MRRTLFTVLLLAACGDDGSNRLADAPPASDDAAIDAPTAPVTVTIIQDGEPRVDVDVYFQQADGTLAAKVATDDNGVASAVVESGATVTAVGAFRILTGVPSGTSLHTWVGVKPGDALRLDEGLANDVGVTIRAPRDPGQVRYSLRTTCSFSEEDMDPPAGSASVPTDDVQLLNCGATTEALVQTRDANDANARHLYVPSVAVPSDNSIDLTGDYEATPAGTWTWTNVPGNSLYMRTAIVTPTGVIYAFDAGVDATNGMATYSRPRPAIPNSVLVTVSQLPWSSRTRHEIVDWGSSSYDLTNATLPDYQTAPIVEPANRRISWTSTGGQTPDATFLRFRVADANQAYTWQVIAPYAGAQLVLPDLPAELDAFDLTAGDDVDIYDIVTIKAPGGYDAFRAWALDVDLDDPLAFAVSSSGRAQLAHYGLQPLIPPPSERPRRPAFTRTAR